MKDVMLCVLALSPISFVIVCCLLQLQPGEALTLLSQINL